MAPKEGSAVSVLMTSAAEAVATAFFIAFLVLVGVLVLGCVVGFFFGRDR